VTKIEYDEFAFLHENALEFALEWSGPPAVRREFVEVRPSFRISALVWGTAEPQLVFIHGGSQNAHTWDTVALALQRPMVAIDLPGHGHSDGPNHSVFSIDSNADDVAAAIRLLAPTARAVIGMSLGGLTTLALAGRHPELVRAIVLVDILPSSDRTKGSVITAFVNGPASFPSFDDILARTIEFNPTRSVSSLRRGILHNAEQQPDGSWVWRHQRDRGEPSHSEIPPMTFEDRFGHLWGVIDTIQVPLMLVRGMASSSVLADDHEDELRRRLPAARIERIVDAGHSVQGDTPVELAALIRDFVV
jgi:pimeloyl-ACP methyl ester carboxylesterase